MRLNVNVFVRATLRNDPTTYTALLFDIGVLPAAPALCFRLWKPNLGMEMTMSLSWPFFWGNRNVLVIQSCSWVTLQQLTLQNNTMKPKRVAHSASLIFIIVNGRGRVAHACELYLFRHLPYVIRSDDWTTPCRVGSAYPSTLLYF